MGFESLYKLSVVLNVIDNLSNPMKGIGNNTQGSISALDKMGASFDSAIQSGLVMGGAGVQIAEGLMTPVQATFDTKRAISELSSLGVEKLEMMENAAKDFSNTWSGTTKSDFITAAYDIKSGIASLSDEGVAQYTNMAGMTAKATKSTIGTMTSLFATGYGIYKDFYSDLSDEQFAAMFSAGISTSVKDYKTSGDEMAAAIERLGASATNAQIPLEEQLAILGMLQSTMSGSEAGTQYNAFLRSAVKGGEKLGMSFVDANNQMLSMPEIMDKLHDKFGETIDATEKLQLQEAFGDTEAVKMIDLMYNKTGALQGNILSLYESMGQGEAATRKMAETINNSDPSSFEILAQKAHNVAETIGNIVSPKVMEYGSKIGETLDKVDEWVVKNPELVNTIFMIIAAIGGFLLAGGGLKIVIGTIGHNVINLIKFGKQTYAVFTSLKNGATVAVPVIKSLGSGILSFGRTAVTSAATAMGPLISSVWSFTAALLANPITWIVIGIVALVAGIILLYNKCEWFRNLVDSLASALKDRLGSAINFIKTIFTGVAGFLGSGMEAAQDTVNEKLDNIRQAYVSHGGGIKGAAAAAIEGVKGFYTAGFTFIDNLTGGKLTEIKDKFAETPIGEAMGKVMEAAKSTVDEKLGNMRQAYVNHGGGIKGVAAAAVEGVKGFYTAGFTFVDNLTGGKLSGIQQKFSDGISNIKNTISNSISWFKNSGKKIMDTFTSGIQSAINKPVEAVKNGLQKVRNMLPFSDAKVGPLSQLTLSGTKVMSTFSTGILKGGNMPAQATEESFDKIDLSLKKKAGGITPRNSMGTDGETPEGKEKAARKTVIEKLMLNVDLKTIKDLKQLLKLVEEIEEYTNSRGDDTAPQPA